MRVIKPDYHVVGTTVMIIPGITQNLRLPGQYFDLETGFHYNLNRDYMPNLGRYLQADPIGLSGGLNPYTYAHNNPGALTDRLGLASGYSEISCARFGLCGLRANMASDWSQSDNEDFIRALNVNSGLLFFEGLFVATLPGGEPFGFGMILASIGCGDEATLLQSDPFQAGLNGALDAFVQGTPAEPLVNVFRLANDSFVPDDSLSGAYECDKLGYCK